MQQSESRIDYLIIGQGLAGTLLAFELLERNQKVMIQDIALPGASSIVAEGIMNPVLLKWYTYSWNHRNFFSKAFETYRSLDRKLNINSFSDQPLTKIFPSKEDQKQWIKKRKLIPELSEPFEIEAPFQAPFGAGQISGCASLNTTLFLNSARTFFINKSLLIESNAQDLINKADHLNSIPTNTHCIVFCEGHRGKENPWFKHIPFEPVKGDTITVEMIDEIPSGIYNRNVFLSPFHRNTWKAGATYEWTNLDSGPTPDARNELQKKLDGMLATSYKVVNQQSGIRPSIKDRRPVLGRHKDHPHLAIFNGMGTKGVSLAPLLAEWMADFLVEGKSLPDEVSISRFDNTLNF